MSKNGVYEVELDFISPVHIGSGEEIDPFSYTIRGGHMYYFRLGKVLESLDERLREKFTSLIDGGSWVSIRQFIHDSVSLDEVAEYSIEVSPEVEEKFRQNLDNPENQLLITSMQRNPLDYRVLIPGSSLKGAIRTAVVSFLANRKEVNKEQLKRINSGPKFEATVLEYLSAGKSKKKKGKPRPDVKRDPFKVFQVADCFLPQDSTRIGEVIIGHSTHGGFKENLSAMFEVTHSLLTGGNVSVKTVFRINEYLNRDRDVKVKLNLKEILYYCRLFYQQRLKNLAEKYLRGNVIAQGEVEKLLSLPVSENEAIIRVGRFSGWESVSVDNYRRSPHKDREPVSVGLLEGVFPLGWVKLKVLNL